MLKLTDFLKAPTIQSLALNVGVVTAACCYYILQERITDKCIDTLTKENPLENPRPPLSKKAITTFHALLVCFPPLALRALSHSQIFLQRLQTHPTIHDAVARPPIFYILKKLSSMLPFIKACPSLSEKVTWIALSCLAIKEIWDKFAPAEAQVNYLQTSKVFAVITGGVLTAAAGTFSIPSALFTAWCFSILQYTARKETEWLQRQVGMQVLNDSEDPFLPLLNPLFQITPEIERYFENPSISEFKQYPKYIRSISRLKNGKSLFPKDRIAIFIFHHRIQFNEGYPEKWDIKQDLSWIVQKHIKEELRQLFNILKSYDFLRFLHEDGIKDLLKVETEAFFNQMQKSLESNILLSRKDRDTFLLILMAHKVFKTGYRPEEELKAALKARPSDCCKVFQEAYSKSVRERMEKIKDVKKSFRTNTELSETFRELFETLSTKNAKFCSQDWEKRFEGLLNQEIKSLQKGIIPSGQEPYTNDLPYLTLRIWEKFGKEAKEKIKDAFTPPDLSRNSHLEGFLLRILHPFPTEDSSS